MSSISLSLNQPLLGLEMPDTATAGNMNQTATKICALCQDECEPEQNLFSHSVGGTNMHEVHIECLQTQLAVLKDVPNCATCRAPLPEAMKYAGSDKEQEQLQENYIRQAEVNGASLLPAALDEVITIMPDAPDANSEARWNRCLVATFVAGLAIFAGVVVLTQFIAQEIMKTM